MIAEFLIFSSLVFAQAPNDTASPDSRDPLPAAAPVLYDEVHCAATLDKEKLHNTTTEFGRFRVVQPDAIFLPSGTFDPPEFYVIRPNGAELHTLTREKDTKIFDGEMHPFSIRSSTSEMKIVCSIDRVQPKTNFCHGSAHSSWKGAYPLLQDGTPALEAARAELLGELKKSLSNMDVVVVPKSKPRGPGKAKENIEERLGSVICSCQQVKELKDVIETMEIELEKLGFKPKLKCHKPLES